MAMQTNANAHFFGVQLIESAAAAERRSRRPAMFLPSCSGTLLLKESKMQPANIPIVLLVITFSGNGVRINGARQSRAQLAAGDVIELGRTRLRFDSAPL